MSFGPRWRLIDLTSCTRRRTTSPPASPYAAALVPRPDLGSGVGAPPVAAPVSPVQSNPLADDVWAFGTVLLEMLAGRRVAPAADAAAAIADSIASTCDACVSFDETGC
jgi:hypothetical protein